MTVILLFLNAFEDSGGEGCVCSIASQWWCALGGCAFVLYFLKRFGDFGGQGRVSFPIYMHDMCKTIKQHPYTFLFSF